MLRVPRLVQLAEACVIAAFYNLDKVSSLLLRKIGDKISLNITLKISIKNVF